MTQETNLAKSDPKKRTVLGVTVLLVLFVLLKWDTVEYDGNAPERSQQFIEVKVDVDEVFSALDLDSNEPINHEPELVSEQPSKVEKKRRPVRTNKWRARRSVAIFGMQPYELEDLREDESFA